MAGLKEEIVAEVVKVETAVRKQTKVSWGNMGATIVAILTVLGILYTIVGFHDANTAVNQKKIDDVALVNAAQGTLSGRVDKVENRTGKLETTVGQVNQKVDDLILFSSGQNSHDLHLELHPKH